MRWLPIVCGSLVAGMAYHAGATSYWYPPWDWLFEPRGTVYSGESLDEVTQLPVDAVPWKLEYCPEEAELSHECVFRAALDAQIIPATVTTTGEAACESAADTSFGRTLVFIRSFAPDEPFTPGRRYHIQCDGELDQPGWMVTRASAAPSAPPGELEIAERKIRQDDPGCNSPGDYLDVRLAGLSEPYLAEGGYVELLGPQGEATAITGWGASISLPLVDGTFRFTPVAADGTRGETLEVDSAGADREAVYLSCAANARGHSLALWLLAPLMWVGTQTRRRRRRG